MAESDHKTWRGTPLSDFYKNQGPWGYYTPPVTPSKYHKVLFQLPVPLDKPPEPHYNVNPKHWDDGYVRMPFSQQSFFVLNNSDEKDVKLRWDVISETLSKPINCIDEFEAAVNSYNSRLPKFQALQRLFNDFMCEEEGDFFFQNILPGIIQLALRLPELIPGSLPLLQKDFPQSLSLSQLQVASLLANAFLCTFTWRKESSKRYPTINFIRLYTADEGPRSTCTSEKLKCIIHYFRTVVSQPPVGVITFERKVARKNQVPRWDNSDLNMGNTRIHIDSSGTIEEGFGFLQVDFANKIIGGGVLGLGCVQEEIRFVICPELIVSRLFTEELGHLEAVVITGVQTFNKYSGYADNFKWEGPENDLTPFDNYGRRRTSILVIDATRFNRSKDQFHCSAILRELNKAYVGFSCREKDNLAPIATGNWGCGVFRGDPSLKGIIQLMAASAANRDLIYYSFGDTDIRDELYNMYMFIANNSITITQMWRYLCRFCAADLTKDKLFSFIQQCHFDLKSQPTLKQCFSGMMKKANHKPENAPSSSSSDKISKYFSLNIKVNKPETSSTSVSAPTQEPEDDDIDVAQDLTLKSKEENSGFSFKKFKSQAGNGEPKKPQETVDPHDIINLIDMIDGQDTDQKPLDCTFGHTTTLLDEANKLKKVNLKHQDTQEVAMEIDHEEDSKSGSCSAGDKKRKISDYFQKLPNT